MGKCGCNVTPRRLPWTAMADFDSLGVRYNMMRRNSHGAMISFGIAMAKLAMSKFDLSRVYECPKCSRKWRTWLEKDA